MHVKNKKRDWALIVFQLFLASVAAFFTYFGIEVLIFAYTLQDPFTFILTFFSSNLIILISLALLAGFAVRIYRLARNDFEKDNT